MTEIVLMKTEAGNLVPADQQSIDYVAKIKRGIGIRVKAKKENNLKFHGKMFALANFAFEAWEPGDKEYKGIKIEKNFDQFRNDITVLAGFYDTSVTLKGDVRLTAKSWAFDSMSPEDRERLYNGIINVVLTRILKNYKRDDLDKVLDQLMLGFAS